MRRWDHALALALGLTGCTAPNPPGRGQHARPLSATHADASHAVARAPLAAPGGLRFSPRPNRAREIAWRAYGDAAFAEARARGVPVLLSLSAVWCHWCHVLDETTLSDPRVLARVENGVVPVRVDADQRPDVERRYLQGGWPTVAFLDASGRVIAGGTYLSPDRFLALFDRVAEAYARDPAHAADEYELDESNERDEARPGPVLADIPARVAADLVSRGDAEQGGLRGAPKFPDGPACTLLLRHAGDVAGARDMAVATLRGISRLEDPVEGGFYRYATRADWTVPHFEKMAAGNAELIEAYALAARDFPDGIAGARRAVSWALATLRDRDTGFFAASQDADEAYSALGTLEARRALASPFVDRTPLAAVQARFGRALLVASESLAEPSWRAPALAALGFLRDRMRRSDGAVYHAVVAGEPTLAGDLGDLAWAVRGWVRAAGVTGEREAWLGPARAAIAFAQRELSAPGGGFYDRPAAGEGERAAGRLTTRVRDFELNAVMALALAEFALATGESDKLDLARSTLGAFGGAWRGRAAHGALYALAVEAVDAAARARP